MIVRYARSPCNTPEGAGDGLGAAVGAAARALREGLGEVERALIDTRSKSPLLFPYGLHEKFNGLFDAVDSADYAPPENARAVFAELSARLDEQAARFRTVVAERGGALDEAIRAAGLPPFGLVD